MEKERNIGKHTFTVPEGYFEKLNSEILNATVERHPIRVQQKKHISGFFGHFIGYAAAIALIFVVANTFMSNHNTNNSTVWADSYNAENEYIDNVLNSYTIDDYTFYCYLTDSDFE